MIVAIIGTAGIPARYGGFETLAENLAKFDKKNSYIVFCSSTHFNNKKRFYLNARLRYVNINANGKSSIFYDLINMIFSFNSDIMLVLGVSGCFFLPFIRLFFRGKIITNVDGIEWKRAKWGKLARYYLKLSEWFAVRFSHHIIADNQGIVNYLKATYNKKSSLISYGADHLTICDPEKLKKEYKEYISKSFAISVCRIEPENNIHIILDAFCRQEKYSLVVVGNWGYSKYGKMLKKKYSNLKHLVLLDPIYQIEDISYLRSLADFYVHGHSAGGTNPSLIEAMFLSLPVLAYDCIYNRETTENSALFWNSSDQLYKLVENVDSLELQVLGKKMNEIVLRKYKWSFICEQYSSLYESI